jgi:hypothetical protein
MVGERSVAPRPKGDSLVRAIEMYPLSFTGLDLARQNHAGVSQHLLAMLMETSS